MMALIFIVIPQYILATIVATLVVYFGARIVTDSKWPYRLVLAGAIAWPIGDVLLSKAVLGAYCWGKNGSKIYRTVENVEGFFVAEISSGCGISCLQALIKDEDKRYRFIEAQVGELVPYRNPLGRFETSAEQYEDALVPGPGLYRFTREEPGHPNCKIYDEWLSKKKGLIDHKEYHRNCIATWKVNEKLSKYGLVDISGMEETVLGSISHSGLHVVDMDTKEILAERMFFRLRSKLYWSAAVNPFVCGSSVNWFETHEVLKPAQ